MGEVGKGYAKTVAAEAGTEAAQNPIENIGAEAKDIMEGTLESGVKGGVVAALLGGFAANTQRRQLKRSQIRADTEGLKAQTEADLGTPEAPDQGPLEFTAPEKGLTTAPGATDFEQPGPGPMAEVPGIDFPQQEAPAPALPANADLGYESAQSRQPAPLPALDQGMMVEAGPRIAGAPPRPPRPCPRSTRTGSNSPRGARLRRPTSASSARPRSRHRKPC